MTTPFGYGHFLKPVADLKPSNPDGAGLDRSKAMNGLRLWKHGAMAISETAGEGPLTSMSSSIHGIGIDFSGQIKNLRDN